MKIIKGTTSFVTLFTSETSGMLADIVGGGRKMISVRESLPVFVEVWM
ncbi:MAG: hypothetical protein IM594_14460 [Cytophagales bacterium]|nr:hypothetical protein [Cytophagales bacterium]